MARSPANFPLFVVGGDSVIGGALTQEALRRGEVVRATTRSAEPRPPHFLQLDLAADSWPPFPPAHSAIICAAMTRQDDCRKNPAATRRVNVEQTLKLIDQLSALDVFVVFLSTNLVFDGSKPQRAADEPPSPRFEYGRQKAEVETVLRQRGRRAAIVRLTKVFHAGLPLLQKWRGELSAGRAVNAFSDYLCSPIPLSLVVSGILRIANERRPGIWQFSGPADVSYADLARSVAGRCGAAASLVKAAPAPPGALEDLPPHTTLDAGRARNELGLVFPDAHAVLAECLPA